LMKLTDRDLDRLSWVGCCRGSKDDVNREKWAVNRIRINCLDR